MSEAPGIPGSGRSPLGKVECSENGPLPLLAASFLASGRDSNRLSRAESECSASLSAPQYAPSPVTLDQRTPLSGRPHLIYCPIEDLRPHPSYARHRLSVDASKLSALADRGDRAFCEPITITRDRIVIDGYARWELAKHTGRRMLECFEYELSSDDALEELIRTHCASRGLTDFVRIELAFDLEPHFQEKALRHQQAGGQGKGLSKLTKAQRLDTRREVARVAGVSSGNVRKVKNILTHGCSFLLQAARTEEVSINLADKWCSEPEANQKENLRVMRIERGLKRKARNLVAAHLARVLPSTRDRQVLKLSELVQLFADIGSVDVKIVDVPGKTILVTQALLHSLTRQGEIVG